MPQARSAHQYTALTILSDCWTDTDLTPIAVWTALTAEGLGANLQHYNLIPAVTADTLAAFDLPETWKLKAQLVFGKPTAPPLERTFEPIEARVLVKG